MHKLLKLAAMALAATALTAARPAYAADIAGTASVHVDDRGYVVACWTHKGKCYSFGRNSACENFDGIAGIGAAREYVNTSTMGDVYATMQDCGAPLGGAYAGELCLDSSCFMVQEDKSRRMELDF